MSDNNNDFLDVVSTNIVDSGKNEPNNSPQNPMPQTLDTMVIGVVVDVLKESMYCFTEYQKCKQQEITERTRIKSQLKAILGKIKVDKEIFIHVVNSQFEERENLYKRMDKMIDLALELQDVEMLKYCYEYNMLIFKEAANPLDKLMTPTDLSGLISKGRG